MATEAKIKSITPIKRNLPRPSKFVFEVAAQVAIPAKIRLVAPKAIMINCAPFLNCRVCVKIPVSIKPINPVKPSNKRTPVPVFLFFSIAQKKPKAIAMKTIKPIKGLVRKNEKPVVTPTHAPKMVGTIVKANRANVFRRTRLRVIASVRVLLAL